MSEVTTMFRSRLTVVWAVLVAATFASWVVTNPQGDQVVGSVLIIVVASFKFYLVGRYFMEIGSGPVLLKRALALYCASVCAVLIAVYLV